MEYVITDRTSTDLDVYWFARGLPTLELARREAKHYPAATYILEYKKDRPTKGVLPTGRSWKL